MAKLDENITKGLILPENEPGQELPVLSVNTLGNNALADLYRARVVQEVFLPCKLPLVAGYKLAGLCVSSGQLGGDFYDLLELPEERTLLCVADVMGKGTAASLLAATLRGQIRAMAGWVSEPAELLTRLNENLAVDLSRLDAYITAQIVLLQPREGSFKVANAGHCSPVLLESEGNVRILLNDGFPLGIMAGIEYVQQTLPLTFRKLLLYTDGITETRDAQGELFGEERLVQWFTRTFRSKAGPREDLHDLQLTLQAFRLDLNPDDDMTALLLARE